MILIETFLTQLQHSFSTIDPTIIEILKVLGVAIGWIGGLALFVWWKDKRKQSGVVEHA